MSSRKRPFSVRQFLRDRQALLVHFSTPTPRNPELSFPFDLRRAKELRNVALSFSTIMPRDVGPYQTDIHPEDANAQGSIGIVVDIPTDDCVATVGPTDHGSFYDIENRRIGHVGSPPDAEACARSIIERRTSNEWQVGNFDFIGIFVFMPAVAFRRLSDDVIIEVPIGLDTVLAEFPDDRVISCGNGRFLEYDRKLSAWITSSYESIVPTIISDRDNRRSDVRRLGQGNAWIQ